jgi:hypothetical protein
MSTFVAGLTGMRQSPTPSAGLLPSPTPGTTTAESKQNAGDAGESFAISKNRLLELAESKALGLYGNSDALAKAIRDDKLDRRLGVRAPVDNTYSFSIAEIRALAEEGALTLFGEGEKLVALIASNSLEQLLKLENK